MAIKFANNATSTLASGISNSATSLTVQTGHGARFPAISGSDYCRITLEEGSNLEIVKVTARSGDTFTVVRGQEGTSGVAFNAGAKVEQRGTAADLTDLIKELFAPTIRGYVENAVSANSGTAYTLDISDAALQVITQTGNCTFTFPTVALGKSFLLMLKTGSGGYSVTWPSVTNPVKWPNGINPVITSAANKMDLFSFTSDGTNWIGRVVGQGYPV